MFTAQQAIEKLDDAIDKTGQEITIERLVPNGTAITLTVMGFVRGYKPDELANGVQQGDSMVTISPTSLIGSPFEGNLPGVNNKLTTGGRRRNIQMTDPVYMAGVLVRLNLQVRG